MPHAKRKHSQRKKARRSLAGLYALQNSLCHWCKSACAIIESIPPECRLKVHSGFVVWTDGALTFRARIAAVDHLQKIEHGGSSDPENLVMACADCNKDRTATRSPVPDAIRRVCPDCHGKKVPKQTRCRSCNVRRRIDWILSHGWEEVPSREPGQSVFRDPLAGSLHILRHAAEMQAQRLKDGNTAGNIPSDTSEKSSHR